MKSNVYILLFFDVDTKQTEQLDELTRNILSLDISKDDLLSTQSFNFLVFLSVSII